MRYWILLFFLSVTLWGVDTTLEVTKAVAEESLPKLVIENSSPETELDGQKFHKMISADMKVIALFDVNDSYTEQPFESAINGSDMGYTLRYRLSNDGSGGYKADVRLFHNNDNLFAKTYLLQQREMLVFLAHSIAYDINTKMGGTPVEWMKRKVLLVRSKGARHSEIIVTDYTLAYQRVILSGGMYGFAKWANREQTDFYYTSLSDFSPTIYRVNLASGVKTFVVSSDGMAVCSDVSEDGKKLLLTLAPKGQPDVYLYNLVSNEKKRITDYSGIDVNGQFMDNDTIAFVSNRFGKPNVFSQKIGSSAVTQLLFEGRNNSSFSAYHQFVVYKTRDEGGMFDLHLVSLNNNGIRQLTTSGNNDYPRFSYDGEAILYIKHEGSQSLVGIIRLGLNKNFTFPLSIGRIQSLDW